MFMVRRAILLIAGLALLGAVGFGAQQSTEVYWNVPGECWIILTVHDALYLGEFTGPDQTLEGSGAVTIRTNCVDGVVLTVTAGSVRDPYDVQDDGALPNGASVFDDFFVWVWEDYTSPNFEIELADPTTFDGLEDSLEVGYTDNPASVTATMSYRYITDINDVPGQYAVGLIYTATAR